MAKARNRLRLGVADPGEVGIRWLTTGEIAKRLGVADRTVSKWIDTGRLIGIKIPGSKHRRVHPDSLKEFENFYGFTKARGAKKAGG